MDSKEYKELSNKTMSDVFHLDKFELRLLHGAIGICTEVGELLEAMNRKEVDAVNLAEEIGDILWYLAIFEREFDFELSIITADRYFERILYINFHDTVEKLAMQSSQLLDFYKKKAFYARLINNDTIEEKCQEIFNTVYFMITGLGFNLDDIKTNNIAKLQQRFGDKFCETKANNRNLDAERDILESL